MELQGCWHHITRARLNRSFPSMKSTRQNLLSVVAVLAIGSLMFGCGGEKKPAASIPKGDAAHGQQLYAMNCAACHGAGGKGDGAASAALNPKPADHTNKATIGNRSDEELSNIVKMGGGLVGKPTMPAFPQFSEKDLNDIVAHLRNISGSDHR